MMSDKEARERGLGLARGLIIAMPIAFLIWAVIISAILIFG